MVKLKLIIISLFLTLISLTFVCGLPDYFNWKDKDGQNWMTSVKQQGSCGSCWAFSTLGATEGQYNIAKNNSNYDLDLSEEYLVSDCYTFGSCCGILGTNLGPTLSYIKNSGVPDENCLEYQDTWGCTCSDGTCDANCNYNTESNCSDFTCSNRCSNWSDRLEKITDYGSIPNNKITIENWLVNHGPISAVMYWDGAINPGSSNITICNPDSGLGYHAVIITGYNETGDYWIVKNSHGSTWGPYGNGYFFVGFGECSIENSLYGINITLCTCTGWTSGSCGGGSCASPNRQYTRTCNPSGCNIETNCTYDSSCSTEGGGKEITVCASGCNYTTIQNAINHSNAVDLISITDGRVYPEQLRMNFTTASRIACLSNSTIKGSGSGIGINITSKDAFSILGCKIDGFSYGIRIWNTDNGKMENTIISNNAYGIFIQNQSHSYQLTNVTVTGSINKGIRLETETWGSSYVSNIYIQDSVIYNNGYTGIFDSVGMDNHYINNNISNHSNYGIHLYSNDWNSFDYILNNNLYNNGKGLYLEYSNSNTINNNIFCPSNTNQDIDIGFSSSTSGDDNTCEKPGSWNDAGTAGCTYYCDSPASVTLLFPPNNYEDSDGDVNLTCEADDNYQLVNVSLYHNISGTWQLNQTRSISGTSNITTFNTNNLSNGTNFIWNCLAYDNHSRGGFASANWSISVMIDDIPPKVNIISPLNQTYNVSTIDFNLTLDEDGSCEYSIDNGATNISMGTIDNRNFTAEDSLSNGNYLANFYCIDVFGNLNNTESVSFSVNAPIPPNDTSKFYIKNSTGSSVAWIGNLGNIVLKGNCFAGTNCNNPGDNSFIIRNSTNNNVAFINSTGDLCIVKGDCSDESATCNPTKSAFIIRNLSNYNMSYIDSDGDLCLTGKLYENSVYV